MKRGLLAQPQRIGERIASRNLLNINHPLAESSPVARIPISMIPGVGGIASGYMQEDLATLQQPEETFFNIPSSPDGIRDPRYFPLPGGANITNHDLARFGLATDAMDWIPGAAAVGSMATGAGLLGRWLKGNETPDSDAVSLWDAISPAMVDPRVGLLSMTKRPDDLSARPTLEEYQRSQRPAKKINSKSRAKALRDQIREKRGLREKQKERRNQPDLKERFFRQKANKAEEALTADLAEWVETAGAPWNKKFSDEVLKAGQINWGIDEAVNRANLEAVPRLLKKEGWKMRHSSSGRGGRKSSRYLVSPNSDFEVRLSDHYLPDTPDRDFSGHTWNEELVLSGNERPEDIAEEIKLSAWADENNAEDLESIDDILEEIQNWNTRFDPSQTKQRADMDKQMEQLQKDLGGLLYYPKKSR